jgi:hypothetical protein
MRGSTSLRAGAYPASIKRTYAVEHSARRASCSWLSPASRRADRIDPSCCVGLAITTMAASESQTRPLASRTNPARFCSAESPARWDPAAVDGVLVWAFLVEPDEFAHLRLRPWLILEERTGPLGPERFAVPRLAPEAGWPSHQAYITWHEAAINGETEPVAAQQELDHVHVFPGTPAAREQRPALIRAVIDLDLGQISPSALLAREQPWLFKTHAGGLEQSAARNARKQAQVTRERLAGAGGIPWAAFDRGRLPKAWWRHPDFLAALAEWQQHGYELAHRAANEDPGLAVTARDAALFCIRIAQREWSGLPPIGPGWSDEPEPADAGSNALVVARGLLEMSARESNEPTFERWAAALLASPGQSPGQSASHLATLERTGAVNELRAAWSKRVRG